MAKKYRTDWHPEAKRVWEKFDSLPLEFISHKSLVEDAVEAHIVLCGEHFTAEQLEDFIERELTFAAGMKAITEGRGAASELLPDAPVPVRTVAPASELRREKLAVADIDPATELAHD